MPSRSMNRPIDLEVEVGHIVVQQGGVAAPFGPDLLVQVAHQVGAVFAEEGEGAVHVVVGDGRASQHEALAHPPGGQRRVGCDDPTEDQQLSLRSCGGFLGGLN
ncbi:MAG: hypothetical protein WC233_00615 [Sphaerochaeta sp.]|jgi:hypothetical protein